MDVQTSFGYWLRRRRKVFDWTQEELAQRVGCSAITIRKIEADERRPSLQIAERLADLLLIDGADRAAFLRAARAEMSVDQLAEPIAKAPALVHASTLPMPTTTLLGRAQELAQATKLLRQAATRLLTLGGPGGIGKTRLALALAAALQETFTDGVWFVNLAPIRDPQLVPATIAHALGVKETGGQSLTERLLAALHPKQALLLLDNFEQVVAAAPLLAQLLAAAPQLKLLVTSRETLQLSGEHAFPVAPLAVPTGQQLPALAQVAQYAAVELFVQRAQAIRPGFALAPANAAAVAAICARLDGLPLAIELAAARSALFAPATLLSRLNQRLALLQHGPHDLPARHQTLRATIDWSFDLLTSAEQDLFARLAVFGGGGVLAAIEAVCPDRASLGAPLLEVLESLIHKSLLLQHEQPDGELRFMMLETIREYALERLELSGAADAARQAHATYYLALAELAEPELRKSQQAAWLERLGHEHDNMRAALAWAIDTEKLDLAARFGGALWRFWYMAGWWSEGRRWLARVLAHERAVPDALRVNVLVGASALALNQNDYAEAQRLSAGGLPLQRQLGDQAGMANSLIELGLIAEAQGDEAQALAYYTECLALRRALNDRQGVATVLNSIGNVSQRQRDFATAQKWYTDSLALCQTLGDMQGIARSTNNLGLNFFYQGAYAEAMQLFSHSRALFQQMGEQNGEANVLSNLSLVARAQGDLQHARHALRHSLQLFRTLQSRSGIAECFERLAGVELAQNRAVEAARLLGMAAALRQAIGVPLSAADQVDYDQIRDATRDRLDPAMFAACWAAGGLLTLEHMIAEALQEAPPAA